MTQWLWIGAAVAVAGLGLFVVRGLRGNMDLVGLHAREIMRHVIAGFLLLGTVAGTIWTFSNGQLTLNGWVETLVSVGGIALALEVGSLFTGLYIQQLDLRIRAAKRAEQVKAYTAHRKQLYLWFGGMLTVSALSNFTFRYQQLGNVWTALLATGAPILLIIVFTIVLRPLHPDYAEMGRQATQRGLVMLTRSSQQVLLRHLRDMGRGRKLGAEQMQQLSLAAGFLRTFADSTGQNTLDYAIEQGSGGASVVEGSAERMLGSAEVAALYGIPQRTASYWIANTPGSRKASKGNGRVAPESAIYRQHPLQIVGTTPQLAAPRPRKASNATATPSIVAATYRQDAAMDAQPMRQESATDWQSA